MWIYDKKLGGKKTGCHHTLLPCYGKCKFYTLYARNLRMRIIHLVWTNRNTALLTSRCFGIYCIKVLLQIINNSSTSRNACPWGARQLSSPKVSGCTFCRSNSICFSMSQLRFQSVAQWGYTAFLLWSTYMVFQDVGHPQGFLGACNQIFHIVEYQRMAYWS